MKKITPLLLVLFCYTLGFAQTKFEPKILILSPGHTSFDPRLKGQVGRANDTLIKATSGAQAAYLQQQDRLKQEPENMRLMAQSGVDYLKQIDVFKILSAYSQSYLSYRFYEKFPNCLILLKDEPSKDNIADLQKIADEQDVPYIVNYPQLSLYLHNGQTYCKLRAQLYDRASNTLVVDKEYTGDWNNPGFEFTCNQGTIGCTINNAMSFAMLDIIYQIASNNPTLIREKQLAAERAKFIGSTLYPANYDSALVKDVISSTDAGIKTGDIYQCLYNTDNTKFVAFFISVIDKKDAKSMLANRSDKNVTILTSKDIKDAGYLDQKPQTYAYIVKGVKYNGKWYYKKTEVTYFDADNLTTGKIEYLNNLQGWDYFADNTSSPTPGFWDGKLFEKITDKRKDPNWDKYKDMWASEELENRDYIGMYELVADQLKQESATADSVFKAQLYNKVLLPITKNKLPARQMVLKSYPIMVIMSTLFIRKTGT